MPNEQDPTIRPGEGARTRRYRLGRMIAESAAARLEQAQSNKPRKVERRSLVAKKTPADVWFEKSIGDDRVLSWYQGWSYEMGAQMEERSGHMPNFNGDAKENAITLADMIAGIDQTRGKPITNDDIIKQVNRSLARIEEEFCHLPLGRRFRKYVETAVPKIKEPHRELNTIKV